MAHSHVSYDENMKGKTEFSSDELMALVSAIKEDRKYILGRLNAEKAWRRVIAKVNAVNVSGSIRTKEGVQNRWNDLKLDAMTKVAKHRREKAKTGGGSIDTPAPTDIELEVVSVLGIECVDGIPGASEIPWLLSLPPSTFSGNTAENSLSPLQEPDSELEHVAIIDPETPADRPTAMQTSSSKASVTSGRKRNPTDEIEDDIVKIHREIRDLLARMVQIMENFLQGLPGRPTNDSS